MALPQVRSTHSGLIEADAECQDCEWETSGRNAVGNGNQHARRTGHHVLATQCIGVDWNRPQGAG